MSPFGCLLRLLVLCVVSGLSFSAFGHTAENCDYEIKSNRIFSKSLGRFVANGVWLDAQTIYGCYKDVFAFQAVSHALENEIIFLKGDNIINKTSAEMFLHVNFQFVEITGSSKGFKLRYYIDFGSIYDLAEEHRDLKGDFVKANILYGTPKSCKNSILEQGSHYYSAKTGHGPRILTAEIEQQLLDEYVSQTGKHVAFKRLHWASYECTDSTVAAIVDVNLNSADKKNEVTRRFLVFADHKRPFKFESPSDHTLSAVLASDKGTFLVYLKNSTLILEYSSMGELLRTIDPREEGIEP